MLELQQKERFQIREIANRSAGKRRDCVWSWIRVFQMQAAGSRGFWGFGKCIRMTGFENIGKSRKKRNKEREGGTRIIQGLEKGINRAGERRKRTGTIAPNCISIHIRDKSG